MQVKTIPYSWLANVSLGGARLFYIYLMGRIAASPSHADRERWDCGISYARARMQHYGLDPDTLIIPLGDQTSTA